MSNLEITFPSLSSAPPLTVLHFDIQEGLSRPFEVTIAAGSTDPDIDFDALVGQAAHVRMDGGTTGTCTWVGVCAYINQAETDPAGQSRYVLRVVPRLWLLGQRRNYRVFLGQTAPAIAQTLFAEWGIAATVNVDEASAFVYEYRVQYGESDLAFLQRILADAGLSYSFDGGEGSRLVLTDAPERGEPRPTPVFLSASGASGSSVPYVQKARRATEARSGSVEVSDFDFQRPSFRASYEASTGGLSATGLERHVYAPGASAEGEPFATKALLSDEEGRRTSSFATNVVDLGTGTVFSTSAAPTTRLCVVSRTLSGRANKAWTIGVVTAPCDAAIRPAPVTRRPRIEGVSSAIVVGPEASEIHVDAYGRVRLRFPWDRGAHETTFDLHEERTPWVRVAEGWAGAGWGMITAPRVGEEVVVAFLDGDPDQPVVVGRVYDVSSPHPEKLPESRDRSVWRSRSSPSGSAGSGGHQIVLDDRRGEESFTLSSSRDLEKVVGRDEVESTGLDRTANVGRDLFTTIRDDDALAAGTSHAVTISDTGTTREITGKRIELSTGDATIVLDGRDILVSGRSGVRIKAGRTVSIQGHPNVQINPPRPVEPGAKPAPPPTGHVVHYKLTSEGHPIAGAQTHVQHEDGTTSPPKKTDANGVVRHPVDKPGTYKVKLGAPPKTKAEPEKAPPKEEHTEETEPVDEVGIKAGSIATSQIGNGPLAKYQPYPGEWCADFARWVWEQAGAKFTSELTSAAGSFYVYGSNHGTLHTSTSYTPQVGDAVVYNYTGGGSAAHVGLVTAVSGKAPTCKVTLVNGNWGGKVADEIEPEYYPQKNPGFTVGSLNDSGQMASAFISPVPLHAAQPKPKPKPVAKPKPTTEPTSTSGGAGLGSTGGVPAPVTVGKTPSQPASKSKPTLHDVPITLEIIEPKPGTTFHLTTAPAMPTIPLEARVMAHGKPVTVGNVRWQMHASGTYHVRDSSEEGAVLQSYVMPVGNTRTTPGEATKYELAAPALVGGTLEIKATFDGAEFGGVNPSKSVTGCTVLGENPPVSLVESAIVEMVGSLAWLYLRLFTWESEGLNQFVTPRLAGSGNVVGYPLNGPPSGTGLVQRDPESTEWSWPKSRVTQPNNFFPRIFWNWKSNLAEGISSFKATYIPRAQADLDELRREFPHLPAYSEGVLLRAAIRRYNGGTEYVASGDGRHYLVRPDSSNPGYVDDVFYQTPQISAAKFPIPHDAAATEWP